MKYYKTENFNLITEETKNFNGEPIIPFTKTNGKYILIGLTDTTEYEEFSVILLYIGNAKDISKEKGFPIPDYLEEKPSNYLALYLILENLDPKDVFSFIKEQLTSEPEYYNPNQILNIGLNSNEFLY